ncbi:MAG: YerC/YecD family TrpR-related protein [Erysipelotrichaceae bacterium]
MITKDKDVDILFQTILKLETVEECYTFFEDLCTITEISDMKDRLKVALLLKEGQTYEQIEKLTGMSSATISRINRCLQYGEGYKNAFTKTVK